MAKVEGFNDDLTTSQEESDAVEEIQQDVAGLKEEAEK